MKFSTAVTKTQVVVIVLLLSACSPFGLALTAGSTAAVVAAQHRSAADAALDTRIQLEINEKLFQTDLTLFGKTSVTVVEGRVLITGAIRNEDFIGRVSEIAWSVGGVREVYNEVKIYRGDPTVDFGQDTVIYAKVRAALLRDRVIDEINYTIDVSRGVVYLMGLARDQNEINRAINYVRDIRGVRGVVNYVLAVNDPHRKHS